MELNAGALLGCTQNWLESGMNASDVTMTGCQTSVSGQALQTLTNSDYYNGWQGAQWCYPTYYPYYYPVYQALPSRPIKLALSEIERLRKAARADEKLKSILAKFTDLIEITVDFE